MLQAAGEEVLEEAGVQQVLQLRGDVRVGLRQAPLQEASRPRREFAVKAQRLVDHLPDGEQYGRVQRLVEDGETAVVAVNGEQVLAEGEHTGAVAKAFV